MSATSVGQIGLDLVLNKKDFEKQVGGIQKLAEKTGRLLASAFAVKKLVDFGKECLELGSDLAEVQNVVDVTFPAMSKRVDEFAQGAANAFGLSETMAKQFTGTFGAMAKAFGFSEKAAYDMSTTLTGLAGDVASFYNLDQEAAYTKLKSVFTGETESLKDLGIVMTQTALDSYALANGFGKTTAKMTEAEKVMLRYKFVQEQLTGAAGDFARTSDGWANQVRILKLQFDSLKATIGQGLINALTPVIKVINTLVGKLMTLANAFKSFTEMFTGKKGANDAAVQMKETAAAADSAAASTTAVGDAAAASAKKMKSLFGFDSLNVASNDSGSGSGGSGGTSGGYAADTFDMPELDTEAVEEADTKFQVLIDKAKELGGLFKQGFQIGFGNIGALDDIRKFIKEIRASYLEIYSSPEVVSGAEKLADTFAFAFGKVSGSVASIGLTIAQNFTGGISKYLKGSSSRIKEYLVNMFNISSDISGLAGDFAAAFAYIFEAFGSENGQLLTANLTGIFTDSFFGITELVGNLATDLLGVIIQPFVDHKEEFRIALEGFLGILAEVAETIKQGVDATFSSINEMYDQHFKPFFDSVSKGLSDTVGKFLTFWNDNVKPILDEWAAGFDTLWQEHLQPMLDKLVSFLGKVGDLFLTLWETVLKPLIDWIIENVLPVILPIIKGIGDAIGTLFGLIADVVGGIFDIFGGLIDFIVGVFTGDWEKAWDGIVDVFKGIFNLIPAIIEGILNLAIDLINGLVDGINAVTGIVGIPEIPDIPNVKIPRLAEGGYVKANTPQLAMIGDNRHQGEVVAPEDKLYQVSTQAMWDVMQKFMAAMKAMAGSSGNGGTTVVLKVTGEMAAFVRLLKVELDKEASRSGINLEVVYE